MIALTRCPSSADQVPQALEHAYGVQEIYRSQQEG